MALIKFGKQLVALFGSLLILAATWLQMPREDCVGKCLKVSEALWHPATGVEIGATPRPIKVGSSLNIVNPDLADCCNGTYEIKIKRADIGLPSVEDRSAVGIYFPAIGGNFSIFLNGREIPISGSKSSTIGPLVMLGSMDSMPEVSVIKITIQADNGSFTGLWRGPAVVDDFYQLQAFREADYLHQKLMPGITALALLACSVLFLYIYVSTSRDFVGYLLFAICLLLSSGFYIFLGGYVRDWSLPFGAKWHYVAKVLANYGQDILLISYLIFNQQGKFTEILRNMLLKMTLFFGVALFLVAALTEFIGPAAAARAGSMAIPFTYVPLLWWRPSEQKFLSFHFFAFIVALASFFGCIADAVKLIGRTYGIDLPYGYFDRYTTPLFLGLSFIIFIRHLSHFFIEYKFQVQKSAREAAIARTIQSLAHDVRRPFSLLKIGMQMLLRVKDMAHLRQTLQRLAPEVEKSVASVQNMLSDILEAGSDSKLLNERVSLGSVIGSSLKDICRIRPGSQVTFDYELEHRGTLVVDYVKVQRVFLNIIDNAFQAMKGNGHLSFKSRDTQRDGRLFIEVSIRNSGSFIPEDLIPELFDAFFTHGKRGGTGLGLYIAKKVVEAHGGRIWCHSEEERGTKFVFELPGEVDSAPDGNGGLLGSAWEIEDQIEMEGALVDNDSQRSRGNEIELKLISSIISHLDDGTIVRVLIVDDESIYSDGLRADLAQIDLFRGRVVVDIASAEQEVSAAMVGGNYRVLICDVDLGFSSMDGFDVVQMFRKMNPSSMICVHSNRMLSQYAAPAVDLGANIYLPKPMSRVHLLQILNASLESRASE